MEKGKRRRIQQIDSDDDYDAPIHAGYKLSETIKEVNHITKTEMTEQKLK